MRHGTHVRVLALCLLTLVAGTCRAAGGHHGVDDAAILEPGTCEVESWAQRADRAGRLAHLGVGCRLGPVELGLSSEYEREAGSSRTGWGAEAKWATEWMPGLQVGASLGLGWEAHQQPRYQGAALLGLATWAPRDDLALHFNLGRDFVRGSANEPRAGIALEWVPREKWSLVAERFLEGGTHFLRAGARWSPAADWSVDVSRAQSLRGTGRSNWTLGLTRSLQR